MRPKFLKPNDYAPLFFIGAFFMALLAAGSLALAQTAQHTKESFCQSIIQIHEELDEKLKDVPHSSRIMRGLPAKRFVEAFNNFGNKTNIEADAVGFYATIAQPDSILVTFELDHCVKDKGFMPIKVYVELMRLSQNTSKGA